MVATTPGEWMTVTEACEYLKISRRTLYRWRDQGLVTLHRVGGRQLRVRARELPIVPELPKEDDRAAHGDADVPLLFGTRERAMELDRQAARRHEENDRLLDNADTEEGRAALIAAREEWMRKAAAIRERIGAEHGVGTDSARTIRLIRQQADRDNRGSSK